MHFVDEANVDKRRRSAGLEPIEEYAKHFRKDYRFLNYK
jgi:hypothetical protein